MSSSSLVSSCSASSSTSLFPTIMKCGDLMRYMCTNPEVLELNSIVQFPRQHNSSSRSKSECDYTFYDFIRALRYKHSKIRRVRLNRHFTTGFSDDEWIQIVQSFGYMPYLQELIFVDGGDSRLRRINIHTIACDILSKTKSITKLYFGRNWLLIGNDNDRIQLCKSIYNHASLQQFVYEGCGMNKIYQTISPRWNNDLFLLSFSTCQYLKTLSLTSYPYHTYDYTGECVSNLLSKTRSTLQHLQLGTSQWATIAHTLLLTIVPPEKQNDDDTKQPQTAVDVAIGGSHNIDPDDDDDNVKDDSSCIFSSPFSNNDFFVLQSLTLIEYTTTIPTEAFYDIFTAIIISSSSTCPYLKNVTLCGWKGGFDNPTHCCTIITEQEHLLVSSSLTPVQCEKNDSTTANNDTILSITLSDGYHTSDSNRAQTSSPSSPSSSSSSGTPPKPMNGFTTHDIRRITSFVRKCNMIRIVIDCCCSNNTSGSSGSDSENRNVTFEGNTSNISGVSSQLQRKQQQLVCPIQRTRDDLCIENILNTIGRYFYYSSCNFENHRQLSTRKTVAKPYSNFTNSKEQSILRSVRIHDSLQDNEIFLTDDDSYRYSWYTSIAKLNYWYNNNNASSRSNRDKTTNQVVSNIVMLEASSNKFNNNVYGFGEVKQQQTGITMSTQKPQEVLLDDEATFLSSIEFSETIIQTCLYQLVRMNASLIGH